MKVLRKNFLIYLLFAQIVINGFSSYIINVFASTITSDVGLSETALGTALSLHSAAMIIVPLSLGHVAETVGKKALLIIGMVIQYTGFLLIGLAPSLGIYMAGALFRAIGNAIGVVINSSVLMDTYPQNGRRYFGYVQSALNAAGIAAPLTLSFLMVRFEMSWRILMITFSTLSMLPVIGLCFTDIKDTRKKPDADLKETLKTTRHILQLPMLFCMLTLLFCCGMDNAYMGFMDIFYKQGLMSQMSAVAVTVHAVGYTIARFFSGHIPEKHERKLLIVCMTVSTVTLASLTFTQSATIALAHAAVIALSVGPIYPLMTMRAMKDHPEHTATAMSFMTVANGLGGMIGNLLTGVVADHQGIIAAHELFPVLMCLCLTFYLLFISTSKRNSDCKANMNTRQS